MRSKDRYGGVANQFATTEILAFLISVPIMALTEGAKWGEFCSILMNDRKLQASPAPPAFTPSAHTLPEPQPCSS
eukprot:514668-Prymnesium_polylepis.1